MSASFTDDEAIAWPSYVDFLSTFAFVLILFVGYMAFVISNGVRDAIFLAAVESPSKMIGPDVPYQVDYENRQVVINLNHMIAFKSNCPRAKVCDADLSTDQKEWLLRLGGAIAEKFPDASRVILQGQADKNPTSDRYGNLDLANQRAMFVYRFFDELPVSGANMEAFRKKLQISNVGDKLAPHGGDDPSARTVAIIIDYSGT
jgi:flagellar motor protein MotB